EDCRQIGWRRAIDGEAEGHEPLESTLRDRLARVLDAISALVLVEVVRLAVRQQQEQAVPRRLSGQDGTRVTESRTHTRVPVGLEPGHSGPHQTAGRLVERLDGEEVDVRRPAARESQNRMRVTERIEPLEQDDQRLLLDIDDSGAPAHPA